MGDYDKALLKCLFNELEARYRKAQAEAWKNRARQLEGDNLMLHDKVEMLHRHLAWYRHKVTALKEENERLRKRLAESEGE